MNPAVIIRRSCAVMLTILSGVRGATAVDITGDHRLLERFVEDGGIVHKGWFEAAAEYARIGGGHDLTGSVILAFRLGRDIEAGLQSGALDRTREAGETLYGRELSARVDTTGIADPTVYGKYRILRSPFELAVGAASTIPVADEDSARGPGNFRHRVFVGARHGFSRGSIVWSAGVTDRSDPKSTAAGRGRSAALLGAGVLLPLSYVWTFIGEVNYDGARYEGDGSVARVLAGLDWRPTGNIVVRGGFARGISDAAPSLTGTLSAAFHF